MATTTNYGWTTPDDTALVKDGASAIRTLGSSIDTTTKNLNPSTTLGDIEYRSSTANTNTRLPLGTAGQVLQVNSGATAPEWATVSSGGMTLISETVASAVSSLSLSSIPQTYKQLLLVYCGILHSATGSEFALKLNNTSDASAQSFQTIRIFGNTIATAITSSSIFSPNSTASFGVSSNSSSENTRTAYGSYLIDNYASTTKFKEVDFNFGYYDNVTPQNVNVIGRGSWSKQDAITSIDIVRMVGTATFSNLTNTSIRLYGIS